MIRPLRTVPHLAAPPLVLLVLGFVISFAAGCGNGNDDGAATLDTAADTANMAGGSVHDQMTAMNDRMVQELGAAGAGYDDRFIDLMIVHHQGAVARARDALNKAERPELRAMADSMIRMQEAEISRLAAMRTGGTMDAPGSGGMGMDTTGTSGTTGR
jgi:predicted outer membrane protein